MKIPDSWEQCQPSNTHELEDHDWARLESRLFPRPWWTSSGGARLKWRY